MTLRCPSCHGTENIEDFDPEKLFKVCKNCHYFGSKELFEQLKGGGDYIYSESAFR